MMIQLTLYASVVSVVVTAVTDATKVQYTATPYCRSYISLFQPDRVNTWRHVVCVTVATMIWPDPSSRAFSSVLSSSSSGALPSGSPSSGWYSTTAGIISNFFVHLCLCLYLPSSHMKYTTTKFSCNTCLLNVWYIILQI